MILDLFNLVNLVFAILGICVAIQGVRFRKNDIGESVIEEVQLIGDISISDLKKRYSEWFCESEVGSEIIKAEFDVISGSYNKDHKILHKINHNGQEVIKLSKKDSISGLNFIGYMFICLNVFIFPLALIGYLSSFYNVDDVIFAFVFVVAFILSLIIPFGIYKSKDCESNVVYVFLILAG